MDVDGEHQERRSAEPEGPPTIGGPEGKLDEVREECALDRPGMKPRKTADCAGTDLADLYNNEEDGGS